MPKKTTKKKATKKKASTKKSNNNSLNVTPISDGAADFIAELRKSGEMAIARKIETIPTGSMTLNSMIGDGTLSNRPGGFPKGCITEIYGDESTGKTTLALLAAVNVLRKKRRVFWADFEHSLRIQLAYLENLGLDVNDPNFIWIEPNNFEDGAKRIGQSLFKLKPAPDIIVIDSVTAMMPKVAIEDDAGESIQVGLHAKLTGQFLNWITKYLNRTNGGSGTSLILLNQYRANIKKSQYDPGPLQVSSGGNAPRFYSAVRIKLKQTNDREKVSERSTITGASEDKFVNQAVKASIIKNKFDIPYKSAPIYFAFGRGVDNIMSLVILAINKKVVKKKAAYLVWEDPNKEHSFNIQGKINLVRYLESHPDTIEALKPSLVVTRDVSVMFDRLHELENIPKKDLTEEEKSELENLKEELQDEKEPENDGYEAINEDEEALAELDAIVPDSE